jgi:hypothetical protein
MMEVGGNARAQAFFAQHGVGDNVKDSEKKYQSRAAELYRAQLKREVYEQRDAAPAAAASSDGQFSEEVVESAEQRRAAEQKAKIESAVAAAKANVTPVAPLRIDENAPSDKILARKAAVSKQQTLGATKAAANAFDDFDNESDDEANATNGAAGGSGADGKASAVTRSDLAAAALAASGSAPAAASGSLSNSTSTAKADDKPKGRCVRCVASACCYTYVEAKLVQTIGL